LASWALAVLAAAMTAAMVMDRAAWQQAMAEQLQVAAGLAKPAPRELVAAGLAPRELVRVGPLAPRELVRAGPLAPRELVRVVPPLAEPPVCGLAVVLARKQQPYFT